MGPYRFCSGDTLDKPSSGYRFRYRFRVGPYRFCSDGKPTTLSMELWSYLIFSDTQITLLLGAPISPHLKPLVFIWNEIVVPFTVDRGPKTVSFFGKFRTSMTSPGGTKVGNNVALWIQGSAARNARKGYNLGGKVVSS